MSYPLLYKGFFLGIFIFSVILITYDWITIAFFSLCCHYCEEILFSYVLIKTKCHLSPTKSGSNWGIFKIPRVGWASSQATNILKVVQSKTSHFLPIPRKCGTSQAKWVLTICLSTKKKRWVLAIFQQYFGFTLCYIQILVLRCVVHIYTYIKLEEIFVHKHAKICTPHDLFHSCMPPSKYIFIFCPPSIHFLTL